MKKLLLIMMLALGMAGYAGAQSTSTQREIERKAEEKRKAAEKMYYNIVDTWKAQNYRNFIKEFSFTTYSTEIEKRLNEIEQWEAAKKENTISAYNRYLNNSRYNHFAFEARAAINRLESAQTTEKTNQPKATTDTKAKTDTPEPKREERTYTPQPKKELSEAEILEYCRKGLKYYDEGDITAAYKQFKHVERHQLPDSSYYTAYDETFEFQEYANLISRGSVAMIEEYLKKYPGGMMYEEVLELYESKTGHPYQP